MDILSRNWPVFMVLGGFAWLVVYAMIQSKKQAKNLEEPGALNHQQVKPKK